MAVAAVKFLSSKSPYLADFMLRVTRDSKKNPDFDWLTIAAGVTADKH